MGESSHGVLAVHDACGTDARVPPGDQDQRHRSVASCGSGHTAAGPTRHRVLPHPDSQTRFLARGLPPGEHRRRPVRCVCPCYGAPSGAFTLATAQRRVLLPAQCCIGPDVWGISWLGAGVRCASHAPLSSTLFFLPPEKRLQPQACQEKRPTAPVKVTGFFGSFHRTFVLTQVSGPCA